MTLVAVACGFLFVALDLAVTWTAHSSLLTLGSTHAAATSDPQRAAIVAAAGYASSLLDSPLLAVYPDTQPACRRPSLSGGRSS